MIPHSYWLPNGTIQLTIQNDSESTTSISGGDTITIPLRESDLATGSYTYTGTITGKQPGPIQIEASTTSELSDAPPTRTEARATPTATGTPQTIERTPTEEETPVVPSILGPPVVYVPETPVQNAPKCCVITGITITNRSNERVFYILNGSYVSGMSPPADQWVEPGESRTFKGDFGECVRIEAIANRGEDEDGKPLTGVFIDQTVCCKDILTGKAKLKGIAVKIDSIEWREWENCPEKNTCTRCSNAAFYLHQDANSQPWQKTETQADSYSETHADCDRGIKRDTYCDLKRDAEGGADSLRSRDAGHL